MAADRPLEKRQESSTTTTSSTTTSTTTTTTSSSTSTSTSTSSSSTSTSTSTSSSQSSTSSTASSTSSSSTVSTPTSSAVTVTRSTNSNGGVVTITRTVDGGSATPTSSGNSSGGGGFWDNKTAVGATFGIAGVIGLVMAFLLITTCIRRRRARKFDRAVSEAAAEAAATNADPFIGENDDTGYRGAAWDPSRRSSVGYGYGKLHDDPFGHGGPAAMGAAAGAGGLYGRHQSMNNGQYPKDAYGMNDLRASGTQPSVYSGTTTYASHPSYGAGAGYYTNDLPPVPPQQNAYGRPSFGSTAAPGIAGVGAAGGAYGQDTQAGYRNAPGNSIDGNEDAYGGYARNSVVDPYPNPYGAQGAYPGPSSPRASSSSPPGPTRSPPPVSRSPPPAAPPSYSNHGHGSQGNEHYYTRNEKSRPLSSGSGAPGGGGGGMTMPLPPAAAAGPNAAHFQPPDMTPGVGTPDESYNNGGRILRVANE